MSDDTSALDRMRGASLRRAIIETNKDRPPINSADRIIYLPDNPDFWQQVAQRVRLSKDQQSLWVEADDE